MGYTSNNAIDNSPSNPLIIFIMALLISVFKIAIFKYN